MYSDLFQWTPKSHFFPFLQNKKCLLDGLSLFGFVCFMQWPKNFCNQRITIKILVPRNHFYKIKTMQLTLHTRKWFQPIHDRYKEKPLGRDLNTTLLLNFKNVTFFSSFVILHNSAIDFKSIYQKIAFVCYFILLEILKSVNLFRV